MSTNNIAENIRRVAYLLVILLIALIVHVSYIQVIEGSFYAAHPLNRRSTEYAKSIQRGTIFDRNGQIIAVSEKTDDSGYKRVYPYGDILAHPIGYDSVKLGKTGIENTYNGYLAGINTPEQGLGAISRLLERHHAYNLVLTIDSKLQSVAYKALGSHRGAIVVLDPRTGAILAMVSKPSFDPNQIDTLWDGISKSSASPLLNRATNGLYPPGSIIKPMFAEAALTEKIVNTDNKFNCTGSLKIGKDYTLTESNHVAHGELNLEQALTVSCNTTFGSLALKLGRNKVATTFDRYGFNKDLGQELQETASRLPSFSELGDGDLAQVGIGQGSLLVTPMRMAMLASAFANKGVVMQPYLVSKITADDGSIIKNYAPVEWLKPVNDQMAELISKMMISVVNKGTGNQAYISGVQVAGKTGTAENPHGESHAWFIGFAPADAPQIAVAVIVENGGAGGGVAAPIARQILLQALR